MKLFTFKLDTYITLTVAAAEIAAVRKSGIHERVILKSGHEYNFVDQRVLEQWTDWCEDNAKAAERVENAVEFALTCQTKPEEKQRRYAIGPVDADGSYWGGPYEDLSKAESSLPFFDLPAAIYELSETGDKCLFIRRDK